MKIPALPLRATHSAASSKIALAALSSCWRGGYAGFETTQRHAAPRRCCRRRRCFGAPLTVLLRPAVY